MLLLPPQQRKECLSHTPLPAELRDALASFLFELFFVWRFALLLFFFDDVRLPPFSPAEGISPLVSLPFFRDLVCFIHGVCF